MKTKFCTFFILILIITACEIKAQGTLIINHTSTDITTITEAEINLAKSTLHIAYGHTSHGSQVTDGMSGLVAFSNGGGKRLTLPNNIFAWNNGGTGGALDLHDYAMGGDVGYYPDWVNNTRSYLGTPDPVTGRGTGEHADVNVIIWSWCGQVSGKYASGTLYSEYINPMAQLELDYPNVKFVYMTGHLDHGADVNNKAANNTIRQYCIDNNKILFDFADIESYNLDGTYFEFADDACNYYSSSGDGSANGNWAEEWRASHTQNVDWYSCSSAHSDALNANQKAYASWRLWVELTERILPVELTSFTASVSEKSIILNWQTATEVNNYGFEVERTTTPGSATPSLIKEGAGGGWELVGFVPGSGNSNSPKDYTFVDENPPAGNLQYRLKQIDTDGSFEYYPTMAEVNYYLTLMEEEHLPKEFDLEQNYPNPFNPVTVISFQVSVFSHVTLKIYDVLGNEVATLVNEEKEPGYYNVKFDGSGLSSGVYICRFSANLLEGGEQFVSSSKMSLIK